MAIFWTEKPDRPTPARQEAPGSTIGHRADPQDGENPTLEDWIAVVALAAILGVLALIF